MHRDVIWLDFDSFNRAHATEHFLVVGASGAGKSTIINNLMASVVPSGAGTRALIYDPKAELVPFLYKLRGVQEQAVHTGKASTKVLNPFDQRCCAWDLGRDIDSVVAARQLATILAPEDGSGQGENSFFDNSVRDTLTAVMVAFIECAPNRQSWTFRDLLLACLYEPYLRFMLSHTHSARTKKPLPFLYRVRETYFGSGADERTAGNIMASLSAKLAIYEPIAAAWHKAAPTAASSRLFSLKDWALGVGEDLLVLGNDEASRAALDAINQALVKRANELVLSREEQSDTEKSSGDNQIWYFLDEVREAGKLDISRLLTKGRSKGACVVLGFQDIDGLRDVYGEEVANEICAQCNNIAVLRLNSPTTAQWASDLFGRRLTEAYRADRSRQSGKGSGKSQGVSTSEEERPFLYSADFLYLKTAREAQGVIGFARGPYQDFTGESVDQIREELSFKVTKETRVPKGTQDWESSFWPRDPQDYLLEPWSQDDFDRLGFQKPLPDLFTNRAQAEALGASPRLPPNIRARTP